jgi:hypothetical protein
VIGEEDALAGLLAELTTIRRGKGYGGVLEGVLWKGCGGSLQRVVKRVVEEAGRRNKEGTKQKRVDVM